MGFSFKKLLKKAVKLGGKIAPQILQHVPGGTAILKGQQVLKALGGSLKAARLGKIQPLSVQAAVSKIATPLAKARLPKFSGGSRGPRGKNGSRMPQDRPEKMAKGKRSAPRGGLDLKAMAAQWRAAGKPGTWIGWVKGKGNQIKKAS